MLTGKRCGQDFIIGFVFWTLSPHARVIPLTETRLNLDNELVLFFVKTCTDEQCTVNKLSEWSFCAVWNTHWLSRVDISFPHTSTVSQTPFCSSSRDLHQSWEGRGEAETVALNEPAKHGASISTLSFNLTHVKGGITMPYIIHHMQCFMHCHGNSSSWVVIGCDPVPLGLTWNFIRNSAQWLEKKLLLCIFLVFGCGVQASIANTVAQYTSVSCCSTELYLC